MTKILKNIFKSLSIKDVNDCLNRSLYVKDFWKQLNIKPLRRGRGYQEFESFYNINILDTIKLNLIKYHKAIENSELTKIRVCKNPKCQKQYTWNNSELKTEFCSRKCSNSYSSGFVNKSNISKSLKAKIKQLPCKICGKICKVSISTHTYLCDSCFKKKYNITGICPVCNKLYNFRNGKKTCSPKCGKILAAMHNKHTQSIRHSTGGLRKGAGRGKKGWYAGYWCDSSWELAWVIYSLEHNINFKRNKKYFLYTYNNKIYKYYPDFILADGTFIEIKGYETLDKWQEKLAQFPTNQKLIVYNKNTIKPYLNYVIQKYGNNFIDLYNS